MYTPSIFDIAGKIKHWLRYLPTSKTWGGWEGSLVSIPQAILCLFYLVFASHTFCKNICFNSNASLQTFSIPGSIFLSCLAGTLFGLPLGVFLVCLVDVIIYLRNKAVKRYWSNQCILGVLLCCKKPCKENLSSKNRNVWKRGESNFPSD